MTRDWEGRTVVYTAVTGNYEHLREHTFQDGVDYIYFTDGQATPLQKRWQVELLPDMPHHHRRRVAKMPKLAPHLFDSLRCYKYAIWVDGDLELRNGRFPGEMLEFLQDGGMLLSPHFDNRHCAYGEASIRPLKYQTEPMDEQVAFYKREGFPEEAGLYECTTLAWDMEHEKARELGYLWLLQNYLFSYQDQVSLPYCLWKVGLKPDMLPQSWRKYEWFHLNAHKSET